MPRFPNSPYDIYDYGTYRGNRPGLPRNELPRVANYGRGISSAFDRYMKQIYGPGGTQGYIKGQVQGASDAISPYLQDIGQRTAANLGGAGGLATGAQAQFSSRLAGQKANVLGRATAGAQRDVSQTGQNVLGLAQREQFQLTSDQLRRFQLSLQERGVDMAEEELDSFLRDPQFWDYFNNLLQAGGQAAGAYYGSRPPGGGG